MLNSTRRLLDRFFAPYNAELARLLARRCYRAGLPQAQLMAPQQTPPDRLDARSGEGIGMRGGVLQLPPRSSRLAASWLQQHAPRQFAEKFERHS